MNIVFDPDKDAGNRAKHGISLAEADFLVWDAALTWRDTRKDYREPRQVALAPLGSRLYCVVYVDRGDERRVISLRKANQREFDRYETETDTAG